MRQNIRLSLVSAPFINGLLKWYARGSMDRTKQLDLVFVTPPSGAQGWILDAICHELGSRLPCKSIQYCRSGTPLPAARRYFFSHYMFYVGSLHASSPVLRGSSYVFATHLESQKHKIPDRVVARALRACDGVICMNSALAQTLAALGVASAKLHTIVGAADSNLYRAHERQPDGKVGLCSAFYERKSPDLILEMVRLLRHRRFLMLGKGWQRYQKFAELCAQPNFEYVDTDYENYPNYYAQMSVFVSASQLEGGPIPLLEAMMSNVVPVASRTGFAPDIIEHGKNGFLFDVAAPAADVCRLIEQAYAHSADISASVRHCDWREFAARVGAITTCDQTSNALT